MKQKVGIAQCLIHQPRVLFLDEPTRGLDPIMVREFRETLHDIHQRGATIVMNSHVLSEIEMLANRVAIIEQGRVVLQDDLQNLMTLNRDVYKVVFEANGTVPDYLTGVGRTGDVIRAFLPKAKLYDFMELVRTSGLQLHECSLKRASLEESFFNVIRGEESLAATSRQISAATIS
jgi:ABC-2 type transport system ATP-binding protein